MARYVECPAEYEGTESSVFLAGGITGCIDWQQELRQRLAGTQLVLINPRRAAYDFNDPGMAEAQIEWEFRHLRRATAISFWFAADQLQPISLYELGSWSMTAKQLFVGVDPVYPRRHDVLIQTRLARPEIEIASSLAELAQQMCGGFAGGPSRSGSPR